LDSSPPPPSGSGFQASSAPPLNPAVSQFASASDVNRYQQSAMASPAAPAAPAAEAQPVPTADAGGATPVAVVLFPGDSTSLNAAGKVKVHDAVAAYQAKGGQGYVKVVGHSSSRTANMPVEQHQKFVYQRSQDRADAVARELIKEGVPANKVLVEAVGDSQPIYYESMPKGEEGNRRAEIFLQS
jgi:outer membrane protein OmpA-like peptidoglycan-associated protein